MRLLRPVCGTSKESSTMKCTIVHVTNEDLRAQCAELVHGTPDFDHVDCSGEVWAALAPDGKLIGTAGAVFDEDIRDVRFTFCVVDPKSRGQGLQQQLIRTRVRWAKRIGAISLQTYAHKHNPASICSLLKCGFVIADWDGEYVTVVFELT